MIERITSIPGWHLYMMYLFIIFFTVVHIRREGVRDRRRQVEIALMYLIGITGSQKIGGLIAHTVFADAIAESIGWAAGSPFQIEVGGANLAIGILGLIGFWRRDFWLPYILASTAFGVVAGGLHIYEMVTAGNLAQNNIGVLPANFIIPALMIALYTYLLRRDERLQKLAERPLAA
jgi:hypothetical protein